MKSANFLILIFLILFPTISSAAYKYIEVTSTKNADQLWLIKSKLNNMNLGMLVLKDKKKYVVYSGPFLSNKSATNALGLVQQKFHNAYILGLDVELKTQTEIIPMVQVEDTNETNESAIVLDTIEEDIVVVKDDYNGFFIGAAIGVASTPYEHTTLSGVVIIDSPKKYNFTYSLESGYLFKNNLVLSFGYLRTDSNDISTDNMIASFGYKYELGYKFAPYFNILAGHSILKMKTIPLHNTQTVDDQSQSFIRGFGLSVVYDDYKGVKPYISYQYIIMDHSASLTSSTGTSNLEHKRMYTFEVGVRF